MSQSTLAEWDLLIEAYKADLRETYAKAQRLKEAILRFENMKARCSDGDEKTTTDS